MGSVPGPGKIPHAAEQRSPCNTATVAHVPKVHALQRQKLCNETPSHDNEDPAQLKINKNLKKNCSPEHRAMGVPVPTGQPPSGEMDVCSSGPASLLRTPMNLSRVPRVLKDKQGLIQRMTVGKVEQVEVTRLEDVIVP